MVKAFANLAELPEDARIEIIGRTAENNQRVAFIVEDQEKADRYMKKLTERFNVSIASQLPGPVPETICVVVIKREEP